MNAKPKNILNTFFKFGGYSKARTRYHNVQISASKVNTEENLSKKTIFGIT